MNKQIEKLFEQALEEFKAENKYATIIVPNPLKEKFAELIVEECRNVVTDVYHKTPLELCGPLLTADEEIANHFYGVEE